MTKADRVVVLPTGAAVAAPEAAVSPYAWKALIASIVGYAMDGFDMLVLSFILVPLSTELGLTTAQSGSLVSWTLVGAVAGGLIFGVLSDHYGRIRVLSWTIVVFSVFTGLCAISRGYVDLVIYRALAGVGLGGEFGIGMALAAEAWPASKRARASSYVAIGFQLGVLLAALSTPVLLPLIGWRGMFAIGVLPALVSYVIRRVTEEPAIFEERGATGPQIPLATLVKDWPTTKLSLAIVILCSIQNFGYYGVMVWMPTYLAKSFGYGLTQSALWTAATIVGMIVGIWSFGQIADRIGRRPTFLTFQAGAAIMVTVYSQLSSPEALLFGGAVMGVFINGMVGGYGALISECYPTHARATAQNVLFNLGRGVGGFGPLIVGAIAVRYSFSSAIGLLAALYLLDMIATAQLIPELKGSELE